MTINIDWPVFILYVFCAVLSWVVVLGLMRTEIESSPLPLRIFREVSLLVFMLFFWWALLIAAIFLLLAVLIENHNF